MKQHKTIRRVFSITLLLVFFIAIFPFSALPSVQAASQEQRLADAYKAYYEQLMSEVAKYGIGVEPDPNLQGWEKVQEQWFEKSNKGGYAGQGVFYAELIAFGDSPIPQLFYAFDYGVLSERAVCYTYVFGYTNTLEQYSPDDSTQDGFLFGGHGEANVEIVTTNSGEVHLLHREYDYEYDYIDDEEIMTTTWTDTYYTVRNNRWVIVPENQLEGIQTRPIAYEPSTVNAVLSTLQSSQNSMNPSTNTPSTWALSEVNEAISIGLVTESLSNAGWQVPTTRLAAANAIVLLIEKVSEKTMMQIASEREWDLFENQFSDTSNPAVTFLKYAGVTTGIGDNKFEPNGIFTRAQIVTMIGRSAEVFFGVTAQGSNPFNDVPDWAAPYVGYAADNNITQGVGGGRFNSNGALENQHTAIFCLRAFKVWKSIE
ncbi:MAG: S-layer homology domain-containing protein [Oscillospiraceae bacterium]|nr:S-layer homology domain-containing protein [Oscillospiraceae bacterium]